MTAKSAKSAKSAVHEFAAAMLVLAVRPAHAAALAHALGLLDRELRLDGHRLPPDLEGLRRELDRIGRDRRSASETRGAA